MSQWSTDKVLEEAKRVIVDQFQDKTKPADAPYICALSRRTETVILPLGAQLLIAERLRSIAVGLGGQCGILPAAPNAPPKMAP
jgi:hypothetical protein